MGKRRALHPIPKRYLRDSEKTLNRLSDPWRRVGFMSALLLFTAVRTIGGCTEF